MAVRLAVGAAASGVVLTLSASTAWAATPTPQPATATAHAADVSVSGSTVTDTGIVTANPGTPNPTPLNGAPLLGLASVGVLSQAALYDPTTGNHFACAGLVGTSGVIQIGSTGTCTVTGATGGVVLTLGTNIIQAQAILETCQSTAAGTSAGLSLLNASVNGTPIANGPVAANTPLLNLGPLVTVNLNTQPATPPPASTPAGSITGTGLAATVLGIPGGAPVLAANIGTVTCGAFVPVGPTPLFPLKSLPIAAGTALVAAALIVPWFRRRRRAMQSSL
ncbi:MAG: hypothetical protein ACR2KC_07035 [Acidimicrobiales bacterium]